MSSKALSILQIAQNLLAGKPIAKAEGQDHDADDVQGADTRAEGAGPTEKDLDAARQEAQASAAAAGNDAGGPAGTGTAGGNEQGTNGGEGGAPGGAPEPDGDEGGGQGPGDDDGDEGSVAKAEVLETIRFLARAHNIAPEEVAKAFTGLEGLPTQSPAPVGQGVELLDKLIAGQNEQNKILDAIASALGDLTKHQVSLGGEVAKAIHGAEEAKTAATSVSDALAGLVRKAPAAAPKGLDTTAVAKALPSGAPTPSVNDLFRLGLEGKLDPLQAAAASRVAQHPGQ